VGFLTQRCQAAKAQWSTSGSFLGFAMSDGCPNGCNDNYLPTMSKVLFLVLVPFVHLRGGSNCRFKAGWFVGLPDNTLSL